MSLNLSYLVLTERAYLLKKPAAECCRLVRVCVTFKWTPVTNVLNVIHRAIGRGTQEACIAE